MPVIPALGRLKQKDLKFKASQEWMTSLLIYIQTTDGNKNKSGSDANIHQLTHK